MAPTRSPTASSSRSLVAAMPTSGRCCPFTSVSSVDAAVRLLRSYSTPRDPGALVRFEVVVRYDNGDRIVADFANAADAVAFLETFDQGVRSSA